MTGGVVRVLLVDDHVLVLEALAEALQGADGIDVVATATTAQQAEDRAATYQPDVVLMDFGLPDRDGATAATAIRARRPQTAVVMVTQFVDDSIVLRAIEAGCSGYVTKSEPIDHLVAAVRAANAGEALIPPAMLARLLPRLRRQHRGRGTDLTPRELEVLHLLAGGRSNQAIADELVVSLHTVRTHVRNVLAKLGAHSKLEAAVIAAREGLISIGRAR